MNFFKKVIDTDELYVRQFLFIPPTFSVILSPKIKSTAQSLNSWSFIHQ